MIVLRWRKAKREFTSVFILFLLYTSILHNEERAPDTRALSFVMGVWRKDRGPKNDRRGIEIKPGVKEEPEV